MVEQGDLEHRHWAPGYPRHWITLPRAARQAALCHPLTQGLFPSHVGFFPDAKLHRVERPEGVDQTIFKYCVKGRGWCAVAGRRFAVQTGELMVVPRGAPHEYGADSEDPWTVHWFHAMGGHVELVLQELGVEAERPVVFLGVDARLVRLCTELREALEHDYAPPSLLYAAQLLAHVVGVMIRLRRQSFREAPDAAQRVLQSIESMKEHLATPLRVETLAAAARVSPSHYTALFRRVTGTSPKQYFTRLKIHRAAQLLATTNHDVQTIARLLGYDDPLYFSRVFRRVHGVSPREYRGSRRERGFAN